VQTMTRGQAVLAIASTLALGALWSDEFGAAAAADKIIISGASGQLGRATVKALLAKGIPAKNLILVSRTPDALSEFVQQGAVSRFGRLQQARGVAWTLFAANKDKLLGTRP